MKIEVEDIDACNKKLKLEIPFQDYNKKVHAAYLSLGNEVKVPGFRKGKVPISMLEKRFGHDVKKEVLTQLISENISQAIKEKQLRAVSAPSLLEVQAEEGTDISVTANVEILPEISVKDYSKIELPLKVNKVTDNEVDEVIEVYRDRNSKSTQVTDRDAQKDDYVKIDFKGTVGGKEFKEGSANDFVLQVGSANLLEGFDKELPGMQLGEDKEFKLKIPDSHANKEIAGKEVTFAVHMKGIQTKQKPDLNDEFAKIADPNKDYENLQDMKEKIRKQLEGYEKETARKVAKNELALKLAEENPMDVPEKLLHDQIRFMVDKAKHDAGQEHDHDHDMKAPINPEDEKKYREEAVKLLQQELLLGKLSEDLNIEVSDDELNREITNFAAMMGGGNVEKLKKEWGQSGALHRLYARMRRDKTLDQILQQVKLKEEMVDRPEVIADN